MQWTFCWVLSRSTRYIQYNMTASIFQLTVLQRKRKSPRYNKLYKADIGSVFIKKQINCRVYRVNRQQEKQQHVRKSWFKINLSHKFFHRCVRTSTVAFPIRGKHCVKIGMFHSQFTLVWTRVFSFIFDAHVDEYLLGLVSGAHVHHLSSALQKTAPCQQLNAKTTFLHEYPSHDLLQTQTVWI